jgi:DNA-binding protein YbaB
MADLQQLFQLGQQMQGRLQQLQTELASRTIETSSGGGMVKVTGDRPEDGAAAHFSSAPATP